MTRRERLLNTIQGKPVDRPAVSFYEINGFDENPTNDDPFNIFNHPSWQPLIQLAAEKTDRIVMRGIAFDDRLPDPVDEIAEIETLNKNDSLYSIKKVKTSKGVLTTRTRRDKDVKTTWTEEHLLKNTQDLQEFLTVPQTAEFNLPDFDVILEEEKQLGDTGIIMLDTPDPLCLAALLFDMSEFTIIAMTEQKLFHQLLERFHEQLLPRIEAAAKAVPGRLWRIYGPEFASTPYLPPKLFNEYVVKYDKPIVDIIHKYGGYARIHSHGNLKAILDDIVATGCMGLDPIEPAPQGDVELKYVRENYGKELVLFGNLEASDIENLPTPEFAEKVKRALDEGTSGEGRGFVLMPSACPYGRILTKLAMNNYEKMIELVDKF